MGDEWLSFGDRGLTFTDPEHLWLGLGAIAFLLIPAIVWLRRRVRSLRIDAEGVANRSAVEMDAPTPNALAAWRIWLASAARAVAYLLTVSAAAGAAIVTHVKEDRLSVVTMADHSASMSTDEQTWISDWLGDLVTSMRTDDRLASIGFGLAPTLLQELGPPRTSEATRDEIRSRVDPSATNLMAAIDSAASLSPGGRVALVLVSDGNQTVGDAAVAAENARRRGMKIFPIVPPRAHAALAIEHVAAPDRVREGQELTLSVAIENRSNQIAEASLVARRFDVELGRVPLRVAPGRSIVDATVRAGAAGHYAVNLSLEDVGGSDVRPARTRRSAPVTVLPPPRLLLVSRSPALVPLLREGGFEVDYKSRLEASSEADLLRYHAVVLGDVSRSDLDISATSALERYVRERGGGLVLAAGRALLTDSANRGSALERILPVRVKEQPPKPPERQPLSLFLVIDRSSSMTYGMDPHDREPTRMTYAREAALALISQLEDRDLVGAAAFDTQTSVLAPVAPLAENRATLNDLISRLMPSGGTDFKEALEIGARQLIATSRPVKHILLLTDGASIRPAAEHDALVAALTQARVTVSAIRIGDDQESFQLIKRIAETTGGQFYLVKEGATLPALMIRDTEKRASRDLGEKPVGSDKPRAKASEAGDEPTPFRPRLAKTNQALTGFSSDDLPELLQFAPVPLKPGADALLTTDHAGDRQPILATWQIGLGRVAVFTADPSEQWQSWGHVRRFWSQLIRWTARSESAEEVQVAVRKQRDRTVLSVDTFDGGEAGEVTAALTTRDGAVRRLALTTLGGRHYELAAPSFADFQPRFRIQKRVGGQLVVDREEWLPEAIPDEDLRAVAGEEDPDAEPNLALLSQIAEITGGAVNAPLAKILERAPGDRRVETPLAAELMLAALGLVVVDLGIRLVRPTR